jgi:hypothetical protein
MYFDDRPEISVVPLETALIFRDEPLEMMEKHPVKNGAFRMTRALDSRASFRRAAGVDLDTGHGQVPQNIDERPHQAGIGGATGCFSPRLEGHHQFPIFISPKRSKAVTYTIC